MEGGHRGPGGWDPIAVAVVGGEAYPIKSLLKALQLLSGVLVVHKQTVIEVERVVGGVGQRGRAGTRSPWC